MGVDKLAEVVKEALTLAMEEEKALVMVSVKEEVKRKLSNGRGGQVGLVQFLVKVIKEEENKSLMGLANLVAVDISVVADNLLEVVKEAYMDTAVGLATLVVVVTLVGVTNLVAVNISVAVVKLLEMVKVAMMVRAV